MFHAEHAYRAIVTSCVAMGRMCCVHMLKISGEHALTRLKPASNDPEDAKVMSSCDEIAHTPSTANAKHLLSILDILS